MAYTQIEIEIDTGLVAETSRSHQDQDQDQSKPQITELTLKDNDNDNDNDMAESTASAPAPAMAMAMAMAEGQQQFSAVRGAPEPALPRAPLPTYYQQPMSMASSRSTISSYSDVGDAQQPRTNRSVMSFEPAATTRLQHPETDLHLRGGCGDAEECIPCVCCICFCLADILSMT
ncbi:hypothetical protein LTR99_006192 [Exophiala xenobiotica]|uniref:Cysteine-rich transmembrane CYSTM domain-containing protein n=1 Tax=Vermiconidia calcicola TaxID=1690605 RepID=A0AAV9QBB5_9PEZI|nr:hypothetical protein LTR92_010359 [Exophiala xenobiotica]KAK5533051.1 hypothetical protein LTR23_009348 [Chaetothyriales sp. CCFEE 6169]KAK5537363.1 hypothetical protein LTR25_004614 [Vermiconidia calcicola]KAK5217189.1 hypothetical protein LTR72_009755 [Exophiala xenobiotica]KAK5265093.1 hypothetical protein LTR96_009460 [Exophiala xenobiotica]